MLVPIANYVSAKRNGFYCHIYFRTCVVFARRNPIFALGNEQRWFRVGGV